MVNSINIFNHMLRLFGYSKSVNKCLLSQIWLINPKFARSNSASNSPQMHCIQVSIPTLVFGACQFYICLLDYQHSKETCDFFKCMLAHGLLRTVPGWLPQQIFVIMRSMLWISRNVRVCSFNKYISLCCRSFLDRSP